MSSYTAKTLSSILKTCLGPRAMQKMVLTKINSIELTNDGNSILREMDVSHPSARCLIELSQTQDDECGDGTTSVLILASELLSKMVPFLIDNHPVKICKILTIAKNLAIEHLNDTAIQKPTDDLLKIVSASVATKLSSILKLPIPDFALKSAQLIMENSKIDIKNNLKVEKILGSFEETEILNGILIERDLIHSQMRRKIENPRILILDSPLEYKKGESVTNMEFKNKNDFTKALKLEEEQIRKMCQKIIDIKADILVTEKGISDLALSILYEHNITAIRRVKKSESTRIAKATGAIIMNRVEDISEMHLGSAELFEYIKIGKDYYFKLSNCPNKHIISLILRGPTKDVLTELERNFMDAIKVAKNVLINPKLSVGGGAAEMSISMRLSKLAKSTSDPLEAKVFSKISEAFKIIPSILSSNSGYGNPVEILNELEIKHQTEPFYGINGVTGEINDMRDIVLEPLVVKTQCVKSAFESVMQLIKVDGIIESKSKN